MKHPLCKVIEEHNYTLQEIGAIIGITRQGVFNIINNKAKPSAKTLLSILIAFKKYITPLELYMYYKDK